MGLSLNAERTLEQVKSGLSILYGADYFTEDEWIAIDGLIHKGKYVFTSGPRTNILDEELIAFDGFADTILPSADLKADFKDAIVITETQISTPPISREPSLNSSGSTPNELFFEASTDEVQPTTLTPEQRIIAPPPPNGGLALGYTQAQLDEVKAFNAGLTKAGKKTKPKYNREPSVDDFTADLQWPQDAEDDSLTTAEQENRINSWASEVQAEEPVTPHLSSQPEDTVTALDPFKQQAHGRSPLTPTDVFQSRNPSYKAPKRTDSRASTKTAKTTGKGVRQLYATTGNIFLAYTGIPKRTALSMEILPGDKIRYSKHVSGITHVGLNIRTREHGQFPESVLEPPEAAAMIEEQRLAIQNMTQNMTRRGRGSTFASSVSTGLDRVEAMNAAEWDRESDISRPTEPTSAFSPLPVRPNAGLAGSRFAALADVPSQGSDPGQQSLTQAELRKIIREELAHGHGKSKSSIQPIPQDNVLTKIIPKTTTCWFWKNKQDCRFTADECIHLHADVPGTGDTTNLRLGKPTWGAMADIIPPTPAAPDFESMHPVIQFKHFSKSKTCYYWATDGKCMNSAIDCKYLHEYTEAGVAYKPGSHHSKHRKDFNWSKGRSGTGAAATSDDARAQNDGFVWPSDSDAKPADNTEQPAEAVTATAWGLPDQTSADLLANPNAAIWGSIEGSSAWDISDDKYKPPHVKALEERERIDAVGW